LGFPGGPKIAELAAKGKKLIELPYSVKGMDASFSGILTNLQQKLKSGNHTLEDLSYSLQETAFAMLVEVSERAMAHLNKRELLLGGGVACNSRLQEMARKMCEERGAKLFCPERQFLVDNAAMIAWLGILMHKSGIKQKEIDFNPSERTDDVEVKWR
jgi:N6-L-threonylcarbamoyladenine synthase